MKLRYSPTSPYVRKVLVTAYELGLQDRIEPVPADAWNPHSDLVADNPLGKVPTLITDEGEALYDSPVICEYLDHLHTEHALFPRSGPERWTALRQQALADGLLDAAVAVVVEQRRRPAQYRWPAWVEQQMLTVRRALDALEGEAADLTGGPNIGQIAIACALGYLDFRFPEEPWRTGRLVLTDWYQVFSARPSMAATLPREAG